MKTLTPEQYQALVSACREAWELLSHTYQLDNSTERPIVVKLADALRSVGEL